MNEFFLRLTPSSASPVETRPPAERVVAGDPVFTSWDIDEIGEGAGAVYTGLWRSTPGAWRVHYDEWEYCHILQGHSVLIAKDGTRHHLRAGDSFVLRPGFCGIWEVIETTVKEYVIRL